VNLPRVLIDTQTVSQLDGKQGTYQSEHGGYVAILVDGYQHPIWFLREELKRIQ
jgi:hypothetical protein